MNSATDVEETHDDAHAHNDVDERLLMGKSAITVIDTCMDVRRGENILIVCDPTTTDIGQALHDAAGKRSDRVLLVVMPKGRHHGEEPPSPVANLMRQQYHLSLMNNVLKWIKNSKKRKQNMRKQLRL